MHTHITSLILHHSNNIYAVPYMVINLNVLGGGGSSEENGACLVYRMSPFVILCPTKLGWVGMGVGNGVASDVQPFGPPYVCPHFVFRRRTRKPIEI